MDQVDRDNFRLLLAAFTERSNIAIREVATAIGCSEHALTRILARSTWPSDEMLKQGGTMFALGFERYKTLTKAEREKISEAIGAVGGGALGFGAITAAVSTLGISGLSAAGITSGLAALGGIVAGGMMAGVMVAAAIPIAVGALGYALIKGVKYFAGAYNLKREDYDPFWERPLEVEE